MAVLTQEFEKIFNGVRITAAFYMNMLVVSPTELRLKVIKEYHESATRGYRGINKITYRVEQDFY